MLCCSEMRQYYHNLVTGIVFSIPWRQVSRKWERYLQDKVCDESWCNGLTET